MSAILIYPPFLSKLKYSDIQYRSFVEKLALCFSTENLVTELLEAEATHTGTYCFKLKSLISQKRVSLQRFLQSNPQTVSAVFKPEKSYCFYHKPTEEGVLPCIEVNLRLVHGDRHYFKFSHLNPREIIPEQIWVQIKSRFCDNMTKREA